MRTRNIRLVPTVVGGLVIALLGGCAAFDDRARETRFNDTALLYAKTIEWSNFENLGAFAKFTATNPAPDPARSREIKVTEYQPGPGQVSSDHKTVVRPAQIHYIESSRMSAQVLTVREVWTYSAAEDRWFLESGWPKF
jgi:hypothetical protein